MIDPKQYAAELEDAAEEHEVKAKKWAMWSIMSVRNGAGIDPRCGHHTAHARSLRNVSGQCLAYAEKQ